MNLMDLTAFSGTPKPCTHLLIYSCLVPCRVKILHLTAECGGYLVPETGLTAQFNNESSTI